MKTSGSARGSRVCILCNLRLHFLVDKLCWWEFGSLLNRRNMGEIIHSIGCKLKLDLEVLAHRITKFQ